MTIWLRTALPIVAIVVFAAFVVAVLATAGRTLGYDYQAYVGAAERALDGQALYDSNVDVAGGFAIFLYPPPFAIALIPFALLPDQVGLWAWQALGVAAFLCGVAILPVRPTVRWGIVLLGGLDWPLLYAFKLGQVGPLLFLLFALGWRWRDRAVVLGVSLAAGALVKVQPAILLGWAVTAGRWRAAGIAVGVLIAAALAATVAFGPQVWSDYLELLGRVSSAVTTPHNFAPGAIAFQMGLSESMAGVVQLIASGLVVAIVLAALRFASDEVSFLTTVVASQLLSPVLWDHYAVVLLIPVAWLLDRGQWWALAIPLLTSLPLVGLTPPVIYLLVLGAGLVGPLVVDLAARRRLAGAGPGPATVTLGAP